MMTEPKFTRGPWRIAGKGTIRTDNAWVASINWRNRDANARLIAAAPQMYEALKALFESYKELADSGDAGFWSLEDTLEGKQALAALSAAVGEV